MRFQFIWIVFSILLLISCNSGSRCYESSETLMVTTFTGNNSKKIGPIVVTGYGRAATGDTIFYSTDSALVKKIGLPLSLMSDSTGFKIVANGIPSVFWVRHSMNFQLISQSCGFAPFYKLNATKHSATIDSLKIFNPVVDPQSVETYSANGQNITIYLNLTVH